MSVWKKLATAFKGHATTAAEAVVDANAMTILDQEIREASQEINKARDQRKKIMASQKMKESRIEELEGERAKMLAGAKKARDGGDLDLAREAAERVVKIDQILDQEKGLHGQFLEQAQSMQIQIKQAESRLEQLQFRVQSVKANQAALAAQKAASSSAALSGGKMATALDSLDRLEEKHSRQKAELAAAEEMEQESSGKNLEDRLAALDGGKKSADDILANLDNL